MTNTNTDPTADEAIAIHIPGVIEARYTPGDPIIESCISLDIKDAGAIHLRHVHAIISMMEAVYSEAGDNLWFELRQHPEIHDRLADEGKEWERARLPDSELLRWRSKSELAAIAE